MDKINLGFQQIIDAINKTEFGEYDLIVAIARGGLIPAALVSKKLDLDVKIMKIKYKDEDKRPIYEKPKIEYKPELEGLRILLVDDVSKTGKTLETAKKALKGNIIETLVLNGAADISLFNFDKCINWPWNQI
jgi:hypoxanthine phosphoribosyltransferase